MVIEMATDRIYMVNISTSTYIILGGQYDFNWSVTRLENIQYFLNISTNIEPNDIIVGLESDIDFYIKHIKNSVCLNESS